MAVKLLPVAAEAGLFWLLVWSVGRLGTASYETARLAGLAYWLSPAALMTSSVLGYLDPLLALPALGALVAASAGRAAPAGALLALAAFTKPQAVFMAPVVGLALLPGVQHRRAFPALKGLSLATGAGAFTASLILAPIVAAGAWTNFLQATGRFSHHDMLSGQAANAWWIVTYVMRAAYDVPDVGFAAAFLSPVLRPLGITTIVGLGYPSPRVAASLAVLAAAAWGLWAGRRVRDLPRFCLIGAWVYYAVLHPLGAGPRESLLHDPAAARPGRRGPPGVARDVLAAERNIRVEPEPVLRVRGRRRLCRLEDHDGHRRLRVALDWQYRGVRVVRAEARGHAQGPGRIGDAPRPQRGPAASHSLSFDQRRTARDPRTAIASAFSWLTSTTRFLPRVRPV